MSGKDWRAALKAQPPHLVVKAVGWSLQLTDVCSDLFDMAVCQFGEIK